ncbi:hypothetical protein IFM89_025382 [Coptis chinensis]|uniref:Uncharacterized protein n=1 Tax=Coptis chinensis TaxID=261450 RepID=A0A835LNH4_9MAGN|nr:hypothetical protein IFM89_025382 [Coptis chinensis]
MVEAYPFFEELKLKRMVVSDDSFELISKSFKNFKSLVLSSCEGFTTDGLGAITSNCRLVMMWGSFGNLEGCLLKPAKYTAIIIDFGTYTVIARSKLKECDQIIPHQCNPCSQMRMGIES